MALSEHVLRSDGQDLASSCSYHSLLALLLLPCSSLITTDKGYTGLSTPMDRKSSVDLSQSGRMSTGIERTEGEKAKYFKNISFTTMSPAKHAASLF